MEVGNQHELNGLTLQEASARIAQAIIKMKEEKLELKERLQNEKEEAQKQYIETDKGDSSENQTLKNVIEDMRKINGNIIRNLQTLAMMDAIEERNFVVSTYDFASVIEAVQKAKKECQHEDGKPDGIQRMFGFYEIDDISQLRDALGKYSFEEAQDYFDWVLEDYDAETIEGETMAKAFTRVLEYIDVLNYPEYNSTGIVLMYSTVRLEHPELGELTMRIYPNDLSFVDIGVMAENSPIAQRIMRHRAGDTVNVQDLSTGAMQTVKIIDVY